MQLAIPTSKPFSFAQTLAFLERFPPCKGDFVLEKDALTAAVSISGRPYTFTLRDGLSVEIADDVPAAARSAIAAHAGAFVGANDDVASFYEVARKDRMFRPLVDLLDGLHHVRFQTLGEIAVYSVMMQRAPINVAAALKRKFLAAFGKPVGTLRAFPELAELTALSADDIAAAIGHRPKSERIVDVVRGVHAIGEETLREAPYAEARDALLAINGVGPFSAAAILLRGLGRMDELPWLPAFSELAREHYRRPVDHDTIAKQYGTSIGYWSFYLMTGVPRLAKLDG